MCDDCNKMKIDIHDNCFFTPVIDFPFMYFQFEFFEIR